MTRRLVIDPLRCTGCTSCMLSCSLAKEGTHSFELSRITVERNEEHANFHPRACIQCDERFCIQACPVGALRVHPNTGATAVDGSLCIGCRACEEACPHGGIHFQEGGDLPLICDLCGGEPSCVKTCAFPQAVQFLEEGEMP